MRHYEWNPLKNNQLIQTRGVSFEDAVSAIEQKRILDDFQNPNSEKYPTQRVLILNINNYAYLVPYITDGEEIVFLKTIIPSRKATKKYLNQ